MSKIVGTDLGSTNSCFAIYEGNEAKVIPNSDGARTTQSIVAFTKSGDELVGSAAARQMVTNAKNTVTIVKRLIGRKFSEVKDYIKDLPYEVVEAPNGDCRVRIEGNDYSPEEISAKILAKIKKDASAYLGEEVKEMVITVPAYFNDSQRQSVKDAASIAGIDCKRIINEPTAAALAYSADKGINKKIAVYDLGGSTFDISILDVSDGVIEVLATNGNTALGGHDIDVKLMRYVIDEFKKDHGIDLSNDPMAMQRIKDECEKAKCALSTTKTYNINLPFITADATGPRHLVMDLTQARLEDIADEIVQKTIEPCKKCIADAGDVKIDEVLLVGGQTRMPKVQALVKSIFGIEPNKSINPDEAVALGAAIQGAVLAGAKTDVLLLDVTPLTLAIETMGGIATPMIERNTTIPTKKTQVFSTAADNQSACTIRICQGERKMFDDNKVLGTFNLDGIPPAPRGVPQIEITYDIDANGILNVSAKDLGTQKEQHITITSSSGLSKEEIEKAKRDAEVNAEADSKKAELIQTKNSAELLCFNIEKAIKDAGDKLTADDKKPVEEAIANVREALKADSIEELKAKVDALNKANEPIASKIYGSANGATPNIKPEDLEKMKNDPKFAEMFKNMGGANPFGGTSSTASSTANNDSNTVDAETV